MNLKRKTPAVALAAVLGSALIPMTVSADTLKARAENTAERTDNKMSDAGITTKVKAKLAADDNVSALDIDVDTRGGVVTLSGAVDSTAQVNLAERAARETEGVVDVQNNLRLKKS